MSALWSPQTRNELIRFLPSNIGPGQFTKVETETFFVGEKPDLKEETKCGILKKFRLNCWTKNQTLKKY